MRPYMIEQHSMRWFLTDSDEALARFLIVLGILLVVAGLLWPVLSRIGIGRLPGDIMIEREGFRLYIPIMSSLLISAVLSLVLWFLNR